MILFALGAIGTLYGALPRALRSAWAYAVSLAFRAFRLRAKVIRQNLGIAFPGEGILARRTRARLYKEAYFHLARLILEIFIWFGRGRMKRFVEKNAILAGKEHWDRARERGKGVIMLSSHVGNWEVMVARGGLSGIPIMMVTKHLQPEWLHRAIERARATCGVSATYEPRTFRDVLRNLKAGGTVGFVLDQYAGPPVGVRVPVFGVPVGTQSAVAMLAKRTGAAVVPVVNYREAGGRIRVEMFPALDWVEDEDPGVELAKNTALYAAVLEKHILAHPGEWLWVHRRFKGDLSPLRPDEWSQGRVRK